MSAIGAVQAAMYARMVADSTLTAMLPVSIIDGTPGVFNDAPNEQPYPRVVMSGAREMTNHMMGGASSGKGYVVRVPIFAESQQRADDQALAIHARIVALFDFQPLTVTGWSSVIVEYAGEAPGRVLIVDVEKVRTRRALAEFAVSVWQ